MHLDAVGAAVAAEGAGPVAGARVALRAQQLQPLPHLCRRRLPLLPLQVCMGQIGFVIRSYHAASTIA